jgi:transcriptional regulator with XRE-family HTH domain|nr:MAG TPA: bifunctional HTH-domain containing protein/aminotransferase [Caudoviricetes sp.]
MNGRIDTFANRLSKALLIRNIKPVDLAEKTGISKSKISSYMSGRYKAKQDGVYLLSKALDVDPGWLMGYDVSMDGRTKITEIDVINLSTNEIIKKIPYLYRTDIADEDPNNFFAIYASDNSMAPLLDIGDIAIIKKYKEFTNRKTYLLKIKKGSPIIRKVIQNDDGNLELQAMNMWNFPPQTNLTMDDIELIGEVIKVENKSAFK